MEFKDRLKDLRNELCLTQKEVAESCGISPQCISQLELGIRNPTGSTLTALADYFDCSVDYLLARSNEFDKPTISLNSYGSTPTERELLEIFTSLEKEYQAQILEYARYFAMRRGYTTKKTTGDNK